MTASELLNSKFFKKEFRLIKRFNIFKSEKVNFQFGFKSKSHLATIRYFLLEKIEYFKAKLHSDTRFIRCF